MGHGNSPKMTITAEEAVLRCDRAEGVLKVFLRNSVIDVGGKFSVAFPDVQEREIPLSDASRAHSSGIWTNLPLRSLPDAIATAQAQIEQHEQMMAAQAAYQMTCGDFDELTSEQWRIMRTIKSELVVALLPPALRAAAPLGGRVRLSCVLRWSALPWRFVCGTATFSPVSFSVSCRSSSSTIR